MATAPKVSVIVPSYNYARYLDERITSILNQTFTDYELIIVDDGSSDDSVAVIERYAARDARIRTELYAENSGQTFRGHRAGAELARGEYLMWAEADDSCHPTLLAHSVRVLDAHPGVGRVSAASLTLPSDELDVRLQQLRQTHIPSVKSWVIAQTDHLQRISVANQVSCVSSTMVRRAVYDEAGGFDTSYTVSGDWKLWWECALRADAAYLGEALNYRRRHAGSVSHTGRWQALWARTLEDAQLTVYFAQHPLAQNQLTAETLRRMREARAYALALVLLRRTRTLGQLRDLLPVYRNLRQLDRLAELRLMRAVWRVGMYKVRHWLTFWRR